jgi:hypothetical protein
MLPLVYHLRLNSKLSKPKLNQQLNSTEFEVRLHSYPVIHPPHTNSLLLLSAPASQAVRLYNCTVTDSHEGRLYNCTVTHIPVQPVCNTLSQPNFNFSQTKGFWIFLSHNSKIIRGNDQVDINKTIIWVWILSKCYCDQCRHYVLCLQPRQYFSSRGDWQPPVIQLLGCSGVEVGKCLN